MPNAPAYSRSASPALAVCLLGGATIDLVLGYLYDLLIQQNAVVTGA